MKMNGSFFDFFCIFLYFCSEYTSACPLFSKICFITYVKFDNSKKRS